MASGVHKCTQNAVLFEPGSRSLMPDDACFDGLMRLQVRGALSEVVSALCQYTPGLVHKEAARASAAVLLSIDDTDPVVLPPLWEAVLHVVTTIPVSTHLFVWMLSYILSIIIVNIKTLFPVNVVLNVSKLNVNVKFNIAALPPSCPVVFIFILSISK